MDITCSTTSIESSFLSMTNSIQGAMVTTAGTIKTCLLQLHRIAKEEQEYA